MNQLVEITKNSSYDCLKNKNKKAYLKKYTQGVPHEQTIREGKAQIKKQF